ncbi:MAG: N-acetyltransferase family protein [Planctomycetia bacterium]|nr:N-acetyltransferase family protein [Planctomycetia bacterium]
MTALPSVVECRAEHLGSIGAILNDAILNTTALWDDEPRSEEMIAEWFAAKTAAGLPLLGIEAEPGVLAGFATWGPFRPFAAYRHSVEHSVYVDVGHRRRGIGRTLLETLIAAAVRRDVHALVGGIDAANAPSIALHRRLGFTRCGIIREAGWKFGRWLDLEFHQLLLTTPVQPRAGVAGEAHRAG